MQSGHSGLGGLADAVAILVYENHTSLAWGDGRALLGPVAEVHVEGRFTAAEDIDLLASALRKSGHHAGRRDFTDVGDIDGSVVREVQRIATIRTCDREGFTRVLDPIVILIVVDGHARQEHFERIPDTVPVFVEEFAAAHREEALLGPGIAEVHVIPLLAGVQIELGGVIGGEGDDETGGDDLADNVVARGQVVEAVASGFIRAGRWIVPRGEDERLAEIVGIVVVQVEVDADSREAGLASIPLAIGV